jgi:hypothetical protein
MVRRPRGVGDPRPADLDRLALCRMRAREALRTIMLARQAAAVSSPGLHQRLEPDPGLAYAQALPSTNQMGETMATEIKPLSGEEWME